MKVTTYEINPGTDSHYYGMMNYEEDYVLYHTPKWKTLNGARRWAKKHGYEFVEPNKL